MNRELEFNDGFGGRVTIGGVATRTGDYLMADCDGALIIPQGVGPVDTYLQYRKF